VGSRSGCDVPVPDSRVVADHEDLAVGGECDSPDFRVSEVVADLSACLRFSHAHGAHTVGSRDQLSVGRKLGVLDSNALDIELRQLTEHATGLGVPESKGRLEPGRSRRHESSVGREENPAAAFPDVIADGSHTRPRTRRQGVAIEVGAGIAFDSERSGDDSWFVCARRTRPRRADRRCEDGAKRQKSRRIGLHVLTLMRPGTWPCHPHGSVASLAMRSPVTVFLAARSIKS
jgi:hypothetical protein